MFKDERVKKRAELKVIQESMGYKKGWIWYMMQKTRKQIREIREIRGQKGFNDED